MPKCSAPPKRAPYQNNIGKTFYVAYLIRENACTFTACQPEGSTIIFAEDIIRSICEQEKMSGHEVMFFDLQVWKDMFQNLPRLSRNNDYFEYDTLELDFHRNRLLVTHWEPTRCPPEVIDYFKEFIGPNPVQVHGNGARFDK